jgi:hypothetical protein
MEIKSWHNIVVCGMKGTGKTTLEKIGLLPNYKQVFVFDTDDEFPEYPRYIPKSDSPLELDRVAKALWNKWNVTLLVSEAELFLPVFKPLPPNVFKIVTRGRRRNIGLISDTRRIADLNKTVFALSEHSFIYRHFAPNDIRYLQQFIPENCKALASLKDYWYWHYHKGKVEICPPIRLPNKS